MIWSIYKITNIVNGKLYVGQTLGNVKNRFWAHKAERHIIGNAMRKYGMANFSVELIDTAQSKEDADSKEIFWINTMKSRRPAGYNITAGGGGGFGVPCPEHVKRRISEANTGRIPSSETRRLMSEKRTGKLNGFFGKKHSPEIIKVLSQKCANFGEANGFFGKKHTEETRAKLKSARAKQVITEETRAKMSATRKGVPKTAEHNRKNSEANKKVDRWWMRGRKISDETRAKMAEARREHYRRKRSAEAI